MRFEEVVELISGFVAGAANAPRLSVNADQAGLIGWLFARTAANAEYAVNQGKFVVLLQKDHQPVRKFNPLGVLRMKGVQRRNLDLVPRVVAVLRDRKSTRLNSSH